MEKSKYILTGRKYYPRNNTSNTKSIGRNGIYLRKLIFPSITEDKINQLMIDDESIKYITFASSAQEITNVIMNNLIDFPSILPEDEDGQKWNSIPIDKRMKYLVITEMTAGVGGNVLNFAKYFKYVNAIEIDAIRYKYLENNIKLYNFDNVNCYNMDSSKMLLHGDDINQDIIFFDPPWGGKDYKLYSNLRLNFGNEPIENICKSLFQRSRNTWDQSSQYNLPVKGQDSTCSKPCLRRDSSAALGGQGCCWQWDCQNKLASDGAAALGGQDSTCSKPCLRRDSSAALGGQGCC